MKLYIIYDNDLARFKIVSEASTEDIEGFNQAPKIRLSIDEGIAISADFATGLISHVVNQVSAFYGSAAQETIVEITIP